MSAPGCPGCAALKPLADLIAAAVVERLREAEALRQPSRSPELLISPQEAAKRLGKSRKWLDRRRYALPFVKLRDSRGFDVVESKLEAWMRQGLGA